LRAGACLNLHRRGIACRVYERAPEVKELGVGITLLPHAMREFTALGVGGELLKAGIENVESCFFNRFGQLIYKEPRGKFAGYQYPEVGIHRGKLHRILFEAARPHRRRPRADRSRMRRHRAGRSGRDGQFSGDFVGRRLSAGPRKRVIACDGINSVIRKHFLSRRRGGLRRHQHLARRHPAQADPDRQELYAVGSILTGKIVIYPIVDNVDGEGNQLINWMAEIKQEHPARTTGTSRAISIPISSTSTRTGVSTGSTSPA
jgi:5-methylphenazine-1-carboxylate 1-monooxygenase